MLRRVIYIILLFTGLGASAQQFHFKTYGLEQGLPRVGVYDIFKDADGFLWIALQGGGICRFDGKKFHSYTSRNGLPSDNVRQIFQSPDRTLWLGTDEGVCYFDGVRFISVELPQAFQKERVRALIQDETSRLWIGTQKGVAFVNTRTRVADSLYVFPQNFMDSTIQTFLVSEKYGMLIGTDSGLYQFADDQLNLMPVQTSLNSYRILELFEDRENNLWLGTANGVQCILDDTVLTFTTNEGLVNNRVRSITQDLYGSYWFGTSRGISMYDGEQFISMTTRNGLSDDRIRCLAQDDFGNVWIGTMYGGIMRFNHKDFTGYTTREGLGSNQIQSLCEDEYGDILVGTGDGFTTLEVYGDKLYNYSTIRLSDSYLGNSIRAVYYDDKGYTWLGNGRGVTILRMGYKHEIVFRSSDPGTSNVTVTAIQQAGNKFLIGTSQGLFQVKVVGDYENFEVSNLSEENQMGGKQVSCITADSQHLFWIGFLDGTVSVYDHTRIITPGVGESLDRVTTIVADSVGNIWIGTSGNGLFKGKYDAEGKELQLENYSTSEFLSSNYIYSILITGEMVWLGHERGLDIITGINDSSQTILHCGTEIGFMGLQNNSGAALLDKEGNAWFGTINGLYRLKKSELDKFLEGKTSRAYLTSLRINGQVMDWSTSEYCDSTYGAYLLPSGLTLPYNKNNLDFEFVALNYIAPENIKYSWFLEGFDQGWSEPSFQSHVQYTNLNPGNYTFRLRVSNELGIIQTEEVRFDFVVEKPFWETWWFRILVAFLFLLAGVLIMRFRTRQLRLKQKALEDIIEQRTAEINSKNEMLEEKNKEITDSIFYSRRIQRSVLPAKEKVAKLLDQYFIFFRPKDIVSGDFYWAERSLDRSRIFFAVADCTGHGVPGAMVSLIGTRSLNSAVRELGLNKTSEILDAVNESMIESFTDASTNTVIRDGMDIALCSLEYAEEAKVNFQFSGAQNAVWIVRKSTQPDLLVNNEVLMPSVETTGYKLYELKADKQPIGYFDGRKPFRNNTTFLDKGDRIYLYSDGFADQFGGDKGKKFKYKTLKELILSVQDTPITDHYQVIRDTFYDWKREFEQIDDVCIMGVEV